MIKTLLHIIFLIFLLGCAGHKSAVTTTINLKDTQQIALDSLFINFEHPEYVTTIILDSLNLKQLPKSIERFTNLKQLSLVGNPRLNFEQAVENCSSTPIAFLNLQQNELTTLPNNLSKLQSLTDINLAYNRLADENNFKILGEINALNEVWLDHNNLKELPKSIGQLQQITRLYIGHNELAALPDELAVMKKLKVLHAEYNKLTTFPEVFLCTPSLILVHLNNNNISTVSRSFSEHKSSVKGLILDNNPISDEERKWIETAFSNFFLLSIAP